MYRPLIVISCCFQIFFSHAALAALIVVDSNLDGFVEDLLGNGQCELREAFNAARSDTTVDTCTAGQDDDVIDLSGLQGTIIFHRGIDFQASDDAIEFRGPGADRLFFEMDNWKFIISFAGPVKFSGITIQNGTIGSTLQIRQTEVVLDNMRLTKNRARHGAAIWLLNASLRVLNSELTENRAASDGGAIWAHDSTVVITNSTISSNTALITGGAIYCKPCALTIESSTIINNRATRGFRGAGIIIEDLNGPATLDIRNSILTNNIASPSNGDPDLYSDLEALVPSDRITGFVRHSIVGGSMLVKSPEITVQKSRVNEAVDLNQMNIGPLCFNGGKTRTHRIEQDSLAKDMGSDDWVTWAFDQRGPGYPRILDSMTDAGAYEYDPDFISSQGFEDTCLTVEQ